MLYNLYVRGRRYPVDKGDSKLNEFYGARKWEVAVIVVRLVDGMSQKRDILPSMS